MSNAKESIFNTRSNSPKLSEASKKVKTDFHPTQAQQQIVRVQPTAQAGSGLSGAKSHVKSAGIVDDQEDSFSSGSDFTEDEDCDEFPTPISFKEI